MTKTAYEPTVSSQLVLNLYVLTGAEKERLNSSLEGAPGDGKTSTECHVPQS